MADLSHPWVVIVALSVWASHLAGAATPRWDRFGRIELQGQQLQWKDCSAFHEERGAAVGLTELCEDSASPSPDLYRSRFQSLLQTGSGRSDSARGRPDRAPWECAVALLPSNYQSGGEGPVLDIFLRRSRWLGALEGSAAPQFWMLQGGPGASGESLREYAYRSHVADGFDIYIPDHRGVPSSSPLRCPRATGDYLKAKGYNGTCSVDSPCITPASMFTECGRACAAECFEELAEGGFVLGDFTVTNAARDVLELMKLAPSPSVSIYGISYGTLWAQRILQVEHWEGVQHGYPRIQRAILAGVVSVGPDVGGLTFRDYSLGMEYAGRRLMDMCGKDETCRSHYGGDTASALEGLQATVDILASSGDDHGCASALFRAFEASAAEIFASGTPTKEALKHRFSTDLSSVQERRNAIGLLLDLALMVGQHLYVVVLAFLARASRCDLESNKDLDFVRGIAQLVVGHEFSKQQKDSANPLSFSYLLHWHIIQAELWRHAGTPPAAYADFVDPFVFAGRLLPELPFASWPPLAAPDAYQSASVETEANLLVINGGLDGQTPAWSARQAFDAIASPRKMYLEVPTGGHRDILGEGCAEAAAQDFLRSAPRGGNEAAAATSEILSGASCKAALDFALPGLWSG